MTVTALQQAAIQRIIDNAGAVAVGLPNRAAPKTLPRYIVQIGPGNNRTATIGGTTDRAQDIVVLVETDAGAYALENDTAVQALINAFPVNQKVGPGYVPTLPSPRPPITAEKSVYSVPVVIPLRTFI